MDFIPQIGLGTLALLAFLFCAAFAVLRGIFKMVLTTLILIASVWCGYMAWQEAPALSIHWVGKPVVWITTGIPIAAFVLMFVVLRKVVGFFLKPFSDQGDDDRPRSFTGTILRLVFSIVPTSILWAVGAAVIHHLGTVDEVRNHTMQKPASPSSDWIQEMSGTIKKYIPESWLIKLDPQSDPSRVRLAKIIAARSKSAPKPVIDPTTGRPYPRAIIVDDPDLQNLARDGNFGTLLRHPLLTKALEDPNIQNLLKQRKP